MRLTIDAEEEAEGDTSCGESGIGVVGGELAKARDGACGR